MKANRAVTCNCWRRIRCFRTCVLALWMALASLYGQPLGKALSVCAVLAERTKYQHRIIVVAGNFFSGRHGTFLVGRDCHVRVNGLDPSICVVGAGHLDAPPVDFEGDTAALNAIGVAQRTLGEIDSRFVGWAQLEGQLFLPPPGSRGVCALNGSPVMIVVKTVKRYSAQRVSE